MFEFTIKRQTYSRTLMARTLMARLPLAYSNSFLSPYGIFPIAQKHILKEIFLFYYEIVCCVYSLELLKVENISINYRHLLPDLVPWLNLVGSNYPSLEQISMIPKMFEPLSFDCSCLSYFLRAVVRILRWKCLSVFIYCLTPARTFRAGALSSRNVNMNRKSKSIYPSEHMTFIQRRLNIDATSWRCIDVEATLYRSHVPAGIWLRGEDGRLWRMKMSWNHVKNNSHWIKARTGALTDCDERF